MNSLATVVKSLGLIPPGRLGDVQEVGVFWHDDRSLSTFLNIAQIADLESNRILSCGVHFESAFHQKEDLIVREGPLQSAM